MGYPVSSHYAICLLVLEEMLYIEPYLDRLSHSELLLVYISSSSEGLACANSQFAYESK